LGLAFGPAEFSLLIESAERKFSGSAHAESMLASLLEEMHEAGILPTQLSSNAHAVLAGRELIEHTDTSPETQRNASSSFSSPPNQPHSRRRALIAITQLAAQQETEQIDALVEELVGTGRLKDSEAIHIIRAIKFNYPDMKGTCVRSVLLRERERVGACFLSVSCVVGFSCA
jgi:hypothetical protein